MRFEFDTAQLTRTEIAAAILFLTKLQDDHTVQATVTENGASGTSARPSPAEATGALQATEAPTDQGEGASAPVKRTRRTRAQIEADNIAAEKAFADKQLPIDLTQSQQDAVDDTAGILTTEQLKAIDDGTAPGEETVIQITAEQVKQLVDLDTLRTALQGYTSKHGLPAGMSLLAQFECKRISDVLALDADKQQAFLLACHV